MQKEWDALFDQIGGAHRSFLQGKTQGGTVFVASLSGIGKVNAAVTTYKLCVEEGCTEILSFGCAGGASYDVRVGDIVVGNEYIYFDVNCGSPNALGQVQDCPETFSSDSNKLTFLRGYKHGLIATGETFVQTEMMAGAINQTLYPEHCPLAYDMESAAIAQVCHKMERGMTSVRVISDNPFTGERTYEAFWKQKDDTLAALFKEFLEEC